MVGRKEKIKEKGEKVKLEEIQYLIVKRAITGAILLEVPGEESKRNADKLAAALRRTLREKKGVTVGRPEKKGELRVWGLDPSVTPTDICESIAREGGCILGEVQMGPIRKTGRGLSAA